MALERYRQKRDFKATPEPEGTVGKHRSGGLAFVIQKHAATRLHYDFRLELNGVLLSWAVPKGPSLDPNDKRLAMHVEDHPLEYGEFEGVIPPKQYGAGTVMVGDPGTWTPKTDADEAYAKGRLKFELHGDKLKGAWNLVRSRSGKYGGDNSWLLFKESDAFAQLGMQAQIVDDRPDSRSRVAFEPIGCRQCEGRRHSQAQVDADDRARRAQRRAQERPARHDRSAARDADEVASDRCRLGARNQARRLPDVVPHGRWRSADGVAQRQGLDRRFSVAHTRACSLAARLGLARRRSRRRRRPRPQPLPGAAERVVRDEHGILHVFRIRSPVPEWRRFARCRARRAQAAAEGASFDRARKLDVQRAFQRARRSVPAERERARSRRHDLEARGPALSTGARTGMAEDQMRTTPGNGDRRIHRRRGLSRRIRCAAARRLRAGRAIELRRQGRHRLQRAITCDVEPLARCDRAADAVIPQSAPRRRSASRALGRPRAGCGSLVRRMDGGRHAAPSVVPGSAARQARNGSRS